MKYISIDTETTGLDEKSNDIIQLAMVFEDTNTNLPIEVLPNLNIFIEHDELNFQKGALNMHVKTGLLKRYLNGVRMNFSNAMKKVIKWLSSLGYERDDYNDKFKIVIAGKNYNSFDKRFLHENDEWSENIQEYVRTLDPAILYMNWENDEVPPSLAKCLKRARVSFADDVTHDALEDARDVIKVIRAAKNRDDMRVDQ